MVRWIDIVLITSKTCDNHRQGDKQINRLKREHYKLENKIGEIFKLGQNQCHSIGVKVLFLPYPSFETKKSCCCEVWAQ